MKTYDKLSKIEMIMGEKATTAFELEKETANWKLKTICPYRVIKLGDKKEGLNMKKILISTMCLLGSLMIVGCSDNTPSSVNSNVVEHAKEEKYEIALTLSNYTNFIEIRRDTYGTDAYYCFRYYFDGALNYAFYDNVSINYNFAYTDGSNKTTNTSGTVKLNAGGYAQWYDVRLTYESRYVYTITSITGNIIYWL